MRRQGLWTTLGLALAASGVAAAAGLEAPNPAPQVVPLTKSMLEDNLEHWTHDYAVMFYAPWCPHCKTFAPSWEHIAGEMSKNDPKGKKRLLVGKFNCEADQESVRFCQSVGITHYPTFMMFGYGPYHDRDPLTSVFLPKSTNFATTAKFNGLIYLEAVQDWIRTLRFISSLHRWEDGVKRLFGLRAGGQDTQQLTASLSQLRSENRMLRQQNDYLSGVAQEAFTPGQGAAEASAGGGGGEALYGHGDPFTELTAVDWGPQYISVVACVADAAHQYCATPEAEGEPFCAVLPTCIEANFEPLECRPPQCPLREGGCRMASKCLTPEVLEPYVVMYENLGSGTSDATAAAGGEGEIEDAGPAVDGEAAAAAGGGAADETAAAAAEVLEGGQTGGEVGGGFFFPPVVRSGEQGEQAAADGGEAATGEGALDGGAGGVFAEELLDGHLEEELVAA